MSTAFVVLAVSTGVVVIVVAVVVALVVLFVTVSMRGRQKRGAQRRGEARRDAEEARGRAGGGDLGRTGSFQGTYGVVRTWVCGTS
jgi:hypothetical protein